MGVFFKSFWRQMGRSTGKRVSNALYGDKWSTPYRVATGKSKSKNKDEDDEKSSKRRSRPRTNASEDRRSKRERKRDQERRELEYVYQLSQLAKDLDDNEKDDDDDDAGSTRGCIILICGLILFAGTYHAIIDPSKENVVLIVMLWIVAILILLFKRSKSRRNR